MKRIVCCVMIAVLLVCVMPVYVDAAEKETIYLDDGSYIVVEVAEIHFRAAGNVTGKKTYTHYSSSSTTNWKVVLTGTFSYTGSSAACTASSVDVSIHDSSWYIISKSSGKSGSEATAAVTMGQKVLGVTVSKVPVSLTLSCDASGNLS